MLILDSLLFLKYLAVIVKKCHFDTIVEWVHGFGILPENTIILLLPIINAKSI
jgi:hypothetical protein